MSDDSTGVAVGFLVTVIVEAANACCANGRTKARSEVGDRGSIVKEARFQTQWCRGFEEESSRLRLCPRSWIGSVKWSEDRCFGSVNYVSIPLAAVFIYLMVKDQGLDVRDRSNKLEINSTKETRYPFTAPTSSPIHEAERKVIP